MSSSNNLSRSSSSWNSISILFFPLEDFTFTGVCNTSFKAFATVLNVLGNGQDCACMTRRYLLLEQ